MLKRIVCPAVALKLNDCGDSLSLRVTETVPRSNEPPLLPVRVTDTLDCADGESVYISPLASAKAFGHSGFTGTMVWADPEKDLVIIFLSNRVFPDAANNLINSHRTRRRVMEAVYQAVEAEKRLATTQR